MFLTILLLQVNFNYIFLPSLFTIWGFDWHENTLSGEILKQKQVFSLSKSYQLYFESDKRLGNFFLILWASKRKVSNTSVKTYSIYIYYVLRTISRYMTFLKYKTQSLLLHSLKCNWNNSESNGKAGRGRAASGGTEMPARPWTIRILGEVERGLQPGSYQMKGVR